MISLHSVILVSKRNRNLHFITALKKRSPGSLVRGSSQRPGSPGTESAPGPRSSAGGAGRGFLPSTPNPALLFRVHVSSFGQACFFRSRPANVTATDLSKKSFGPTSRISPGRGSPDQLGRAPRGLQRAAPRGRARRTPRFSAATARRRAQHPGMETGSDSGQRPARPPRAGAAAGCAGAARPGRPCRPPRAGSARGALAGRLPRAGRAAAGGQDEPRASEGGRAREGPGGGAAGRMAQLFLNIKPA